MSRARVQRYVNLNRPLLFTAGVVSFVIGLEEVSWFQRQLAIETPEVFASNLQGELNIHNFATDLVENIYYSAAFFSFVLIPFLSTRTSWFERLGLSAFVPGLAPFVVVAIACSYNYNMWV
jgi:hypothetical protein